MPSKFPHGAVWWAAVTSAVVMAVIAAAFGITVWRYETAQASDNTAETALNTARIAGQMQIEFQEENAAARGYLISPTPAAFQEHQRGAGPVHPAADHAPEQAADSLAAEQAQRAGTADRLEELVAQIEEALQAGGLAEAGQAAGAAGWPGHGGGRPAAGNGHVLATVAAPDAVGGGRSGGPGGAR